MRTKTSDWFEVKMRYDKVHEDGYEKKVTESYVVEALSFGEAEKTAIEFLGSWKSHTNLTHPGKYFRPSKVKIMRPTSPK